MLLFFIVLHRYCVFDFWFFVFCFFIKLKVCGNPASSKSIGGVFTIFACSCLFHILVVFKTLQIFLLYLWWCSVLSDLDITIVIILTPCSYNTET